MKTTPLVSVVIPTFNRAHLVRGAIESALIQDQPNVEVIIVDDGSTDATAQVVESFGDRVVYVYQTNQERSCARNKGIALAKGSYIAFLDSDDRWRPNHLSNLVRALEHAPQAGCAFSPRLLVDELGLCHAIEGMGGGGDVFEPILLSRFLVSSISTLVRASAIEISGGFNPNLRVGEDWEFFTRLAARFEFLASPEPTAVETLHPGKTMYNVDLVLAQRPLAIAAVFRDEVVRARAAKLESKVRARFELISAIDLTVAGRMAEARKRLATSLALDRRGVFERAILKTWLRSLVGVRLSMLLSELAIRLCATRVPPPFRPAPRPRIEPTKDAPTVVLSCAESGQVPAWFATAIKQIRASAHVQVAGVLRARRRAPSAKARGLALRAYEALDRQLFPLRYDATALVDVSAAFPDLPLIDRLPVGSTLLCHELPGPNELHDLLEIAHARALFCRFGSVAYAAPGTAEVLSGARALIVTVEEVTSKGVRVISSSSFAIDRLSARRSMHDVYWKMAAVFARDVLTPERFEPSAADGVPTAQVVGARQVLQIGRRLVESRARRITSTEGWCLGIMPRASGPFRWTHALDGEFKPIRPPRGRFWADPFPISFGGRSFVFFEEFDYRKNKGYISTLELRDSEPVGESRVVLELAHHLSYPFLFEHGGKLFMVPESSANRTVPLYECSRFPDQWTLAGELLSGVNAVDATLFRDGRGWWMFTSIAPENAKNIDQLHIFSAKAPTGPWIPHVRNPVKTDVKGSRPAGRLFLEGGTLLRPAQDCSRMYGGAVVIQKINRLSQTEFEETPVGRIEANWMPHLLGTHTLNHAEGITLVDGFLQLRRLER